MPVIPSSDTWAICLKASSIQFMSLTRFASPEITFGRSRLYLTASVSPDLPRQQRPVARGVPSLPVCPKGHRARGVRSEDPRGRAGWDGSGEKRQQRELPAPPAPAKASPCRHSRRWTSSNRLLTPPFLFCFLLRCVRLSRPCTAALLQGEEGHTGTVGGDCSRLTAAFQKHLISHFLFLQKEKKSDDRSYFSPKTRCSPKPSFTSKRPLRWTSS